MQQQCLTQFLEVREMLAENTPHRGPTVCHGKKALMTSAGGRSRVQPQFHPSEAESSGEMLD